MPTISAPRRRATSRRSITVFALVLTLASVLAALGSGRAVAADLLHDPPEARQFDFWLGQWRVNNRFQQEDGTWVDGGTAVARIYPVLDGKAILELWDGRLANGFHMLGTSLRHYDTATSSWRLALSWPSPENPSFSELSGSFRHGRGEFFRTRSGPGGEEVLVRYTFSDIGPTSLRWDNATSTDGGRSWRGAWIMEFERSAPTAPWPAEPGEALHTMHDGSRCSAPEGRRFDVLEGSWRGTEQRLAGSTAQEPVWESRPARLEAHRALDGCAVLALYGAGPEDDLDEELTLRSYLPDRDVWKVLALDDAPGTGFHYEAGAPPTAEHPLATTSETVDGTPPRGPSSRTTWTRLAPETVAWEIATSTDGGTTWRTVRKVELVRDGE